MPSDSRDAFPGKGYINHAGEAGRGVRAVWQRLRHFPGVMGAEDPCASRMGAEDPHTGGMRVEDPHTGGKGAEAPRTSGMGAEDSHTGGMRTEDPHTGCTGWDPLSHSAARSPALAQYGCPSW